MEHLMEEIKILVNAKDIPENVRERIRATAETGLDITLTAIANVMEEMMPELMAKYREE